MYGSTPSECAQLRTLKRCVVAPVPQMVEETAREEVSAQVGEAGLWLPALLDGNCSAVVIELFLNFVTKVFGDHV